jgi:uncharacterized delta-60 repeat protein
MIQSFRDLRFLLFKRTLSPFCLRALCVLLLLVFASASLFAQPLQREWVRNYSNIQTNFNQAIAIAVAPDGNVVVAGTSQNIGGDMDYEIIKYKPNGDEAWKARYGSANSGNDQLRGMTIDANGSVIVTGTSDTVKFSPSGAFVWSQPLGGRAIVATTNYVYVTGFLDTDIATAQLENNDTDGHELWRRTIDGPAHGIDIGQAITLDKNGNVYVAGQEDGGCAGHVCYRRFAAARYTPAGVESLFTNHDDQLPSSSAQANSIIVRPDGSIYVYGSYSSVAHTAYLIKFNADGSVAWTTDPYFGDFGTRVIADSINQEIVATGRRDVSDLNTLIDAAIVVTFSETNSSPKHIWSYKNSGGRITEGSDISQDSSGNLYVAGYSDNDASSTAMLCSKLTIAGQQLGLDRYNSPNAGSNFGTALAIDTNDNVYVTGYVLNTQGGSEFVTIKYSATPKIEKKPGGAMHLEFHTTPGQQYAIEGTTNFFNWQSLITNTADANGLIQFDDLNAPTIPYRFYRGNSAP